MEIGSSSKEPWPQTQLLQPTVISQKSPSVNFPDNSFLRNYPISHYQQNKPECHSANRFVCLDENWIKQSNFFESAKPNVQPLRNEREPSNLASSINTAMHHAEVKTSQQMKFGQPRLDSSLSVEPTQQKLSGFPHPANGIILNEDRNKPRTGASSGVGSTSMNRQLDELLGFTNQHQYSTKGFHAQSLGSYLQAQPVNISNQIPLFVQMDKQKVAETIDNENQRKQEEPSYSGSGKSFGNREVAGPSVLSCFNPASSLKEEWASQTLRKSHGEAKLPERIKPLKI